jgi:hypothetical protein
MVTRQQLYRYARAHGTKTILEIIDYKFTTCLVQEEYNKKVPFKEANDKHSFILSLAVQTILN